MKNSKFFLGLLIGILVTSLLLSDYVMAEQPILVYLNGKLIKADVKPHIVNGRLYLPVRAFCEEALGAKVTWDAKNSIVNIVLDNNITSKQEENPNASLFQPKKASDLIEAYVMIIDELYSIDDGLNEDIKYLAVRTSRMDNLTDKDKTELLRILGNKYCLQVLNKEQHELIDEGYIKIEYDAGHAREVFREGIFIEIQDQPRENNTITLSALKRRGTAGATGYQGLILTYKDSSWVITSHGKRFSW